MAATSKEELLAITAKEFGKFDALLTKITSGVALQKRDDDTSIKDVVAHRAHWIELYLGWYRDGMAGKPVFFPAEGYKWNDLKRYNADLRARQADLDWKAAVEMLRANTATLIRFIESLTDAQLYGGPMKGARNAWTPGRWAEAAGPSHFRSASKYIRACLREDAAA